MIDAISTKVSELANAGLIGQDKAESLLATLAEFADEKGEKAILRELSKVHWKNVTNPSAYLSVVLRKLPNLPKAPEPEPLPEPEVDPVDEIERELANEETDRREWEKWAAGLSKEEMADLLHGDAYRVEDRKPLLACSIWNQTPELYAENTWATVHRKAREAGTSMHEICRQIGIRYQHVIFKGFGQE